MRPDGVVDLGHRESAVVDEPGEILRVRPARHVHVDAGMQCTVRGIAPVAGKSLDHKVADGHRVADDEALEAPLAA